MSMPTARLRLVPWVPAHLLALIEAPDRFEERSGFRTADGLREFLVSDDVSPAWVAALRGAAAADPWVFGFAVVHLESQQVIGSAAFKGPPDADGRAEIAYGIAPGFQGQGYATEAAAALVAYAQADSRVRTIVAHTMPAPGPSPEVLRKCGFAFVGEVEDPEDGRVWRWERASEPGARPDPRSTPAS